MGRSSFNSKDSFDWLFSKDGVTESIGHMRELLLISPLNIVLAALVVIIVMSLGSVLQGLKMVELLSL